MIGLLFMLTVPTIGIYYEKIMYSKAWNIFVFGKITYFIFFYESTGLSYTK